MRRRSGLSICLSLLLLSVHAQKPEQPKEVFSFESFMTLVRAHHPLIRVAAIQSEKAEAGILRARSAFDPQLQAGSGEKRVQDKTYGTYQKMELKLPLPVGTIKTTAEYNGGDLLNPEITRGDLQYTGIEVPLLRGLLLDKKRAALQQSRLFLSQTKMEQEAQINSVLTEAATAYWNWSSARQLQSLYELFRQNAVDRLQMVRTLFIQGDRSAMDTAEAFAQCISMETQVLQARIRTVKSLYALSAHLWVTEDSVYVLPESAQPENISDAVAKNEIPAILPESASWPQLKVYDYKIRQLETERRLAQLDRLPELNLMAGFYSKKGFLPPDLNKNYFSQNNRLALQFSIPLFQREVRSKLRETRLKIKETGLEQLRKKTEMQLKFESVRTELTLLKEQIRQMESALQVFQRLVQNEDRRFRQGESTLFLVNTREQKQMETGEKLIELKRKWLEQVQQFRLILGAEMSGS